ncbi:MAG: VWA domain-containing protein, partial [Chloroflexi bacterium]|nr:VWA domain-containing protein [Chloroflexota bacterium]
KVKRLLDGEEFDLDAVIDARIERRSGHTPSEKIYWRRNKIERNVAVVLLVDLSLSTDERIERESVRLAREAPTDRSRRMAQKRIIDLEREGVVLFIEALEQIGDTYGIYGFSGSGREDVQFYTIKDTQEPLTERVRRRVDKVTPLQGTRMGPAIRHAISKLEKTEAKTKILIMLSDGRPQDRDYGTLPWDPEALPRNFLRSGDYGMIAVSRDALMLDEKEYAVHDTKQALNEAKTKNITPFCISVDKQGHDYLKAMCGDIGYEVVSDIESLPRRLPALYRRLTT